MLLIAAPIIQDIFDFFIRQLKGIGEVNSPYFSYCYYLLESLSTIKTVVLLTDIGAEDLIHDLFSCFFNHIGWVSIVALLSPSGLKYASK